MAKTPKVLLKTEMTNVKTTKSTFVLANADGDLSFYIPKAYFTSTGCSPESRYRVTFEEVTE